jgi:SAM-dependent methyltransferase
MRDADSPRRNAAEMRLSRSAQRAIDEYESHEAAARYDGVHRGRARHRREERAIRRALRDVPAGASVLDLPCGTGRMFPVLHALSYRVTAADASAAMVAFARDAGAQAGWTPAGGVHVASVFDTGFRDDAFDAVLCNRLFHHFAEPEARRAGLAELRRICSGTLVVSFFCALSLDAWRTRRRRSRGKRRSGREAISFGSFRADAEASGLEIIRVHRTLPGISQQWYCVAQRSAPTGGP